MEDGAEVSLCDPQREPPEWTGIVLGTQCAVFLSDVSTSEPLSRAGKPFPSAAEATCVVFDSLDARATFLRFTFEEQPNVRCEVIDGQGMMIVALRFLHCDFGLKHAQRERQKRVEAHRRRERAGDGDSDEHEARVLLRLLVPQGPQRIRPAALEERP